MKSHNFVENSRMKFLALKTSFFLSWGLIGETKNAFSSYEISLYTEFRSDTALRSLKRKFQKGCEDCAKNILACF